MVAVYGSGATRAKPSVVVNSALGQRVAACGSREKEAVIARARREAIGRFAPLHQVSKHLSVPASIRRLLIYLGKGKATVVNSL